MSVKLRQSQIITTFGPGALVDLPDKAVLVAGLEHWVGEARMVHEPRLLANLRRRLHLPNIVLRAPPVPDGEDDYSVGLVAWEFPEWFVAQYEVTSKPFGRSRPLIHFKALTKGRYQAADDGQGKRTRKDWPVVPIRFVQACPNGHIDNINWKALIHGTAECAGSLWLDERGTTGDLADLFLRCDGCDRPHMQLVKLQSTSEEKSALGECAGRRPWLGPQADEQCKGPDGKPHRNKLLIRHASNAYFPAVERAISIPDHDERVRKAVDAVWDDFLSVAESVKDVQRERKKAKVSAALEGLTDADVWSECERRLSKTELAFRNLKDVELDTFLAASDEPVQDIPDGDFLAQRVTLTPDREGAMALIDRIVLVHRLREVSAEVGFTRFETLGMPIESEVDLGVRLAPLALDLRWLPAIENRGEGIFLALDPGRVQGWLERPAVRKRGRTFLAGIQGMTPNHPVLLEKVESIYLPYILLHSLSHLLITAISLECGYAAASIRERIYVRDGAYGLLLYTGTPDSEGTLGGLVQVGGQLRHHLETALELGRLCSNDPVCAQHRPDHPHENRLLHGAACHGCLLVAEPSCERRNELLDRSLVVATVAESELAFFESW